MQSMGTQALDSPQEAHGSTAAIPQDWFVRTPAPEDQVRTRKGEAPIPATKGNEMGKEASLTNGITKFHK